jgi:serine/threonine-protein kinase
MTDWVVGQQLGPYVLIAQVGAGGMGEVWKARDTRLHRTVAVKRLKEQDRSRFEQEARAIAALNHPHICQIYDVGSDHLVMEYIDGEPLQGSMPEEKAVRLAIQIAGALEEAHKRGIIHRDLKPGNIMVTEGGAAKLLDFGLAKSVKNADLEVTGTIEGTVMGTTAYMSPEQAAGRPLDSRSDIFSFGAVLYEMVSGNRAFEGRSATDVLTAVMRDDPRPLQASEPFERIVSRCLRKQASERFQSVAELKADLEKILTQFATLEPSIAVLPFANMSSDKENEYFSDGLAEEIINALAHIPGLKVTARTSAFAFRGKEQDIRKIATTLRVRTILEGSVRRSGNRVRITAQLINAEDGYHLWSERYDREIADVFAMQDEIAQAIATALQVKLSVTPTSTPRYTPSLPAYEALLKARHSLTRVSPESWTRSRQYFEQAISLDPNYALAHCELAHYFFILAMTGQAPAHDTVPRVRQGAQRALAIDPSLAEAHAMLGVVAGLYDYNWQEAERQFELATRTQPVSAFVHANYAMSYLLPLGRAQDAVEEADRSLLDDPLFLPVRSYRGNCLMLAGRISEAETEFRHISEFDSNYPPAWAGLGMCAAARGNFEEALGFIRKASSLAPWNVPYFSGQLAGLLMRLGKKDEAQQTLMKFGDGQGYGAPIGLAIFHLICNEPDKAAEWLLKAIEQRYPLVPQLLRAPYAEELRKTPRWAELHRRIGSPGTA